MKYLNKTIEYGLYLLVFLLPVQTRWIIKAGETEYATYSLYGTDLLLILLLLLFVIREIARPNDARPNDSVGLAVGQASSPDYRLLAMTEERLPRRPEYRTPRNDKIILWFISGLLLMSAVSVFFAANRPLALYKLGWLILGIGLFWLIVSVNYDRLKLIYVMLTALFLQAILGIWQFLTQSSFANKWLGIAFHNGADLGASVIEAVGTDGVLERWLRAYGGADHPNIFGGLLAIGVLLLVGEMIKFGKIPNPNAQINSKPQEIFPALAMRGGTSKMINWVFLAVFCAGLFFSFSRTAWLGLAIGLAIMAVLTVAGRNLKKQKGLAEIILVMGILLFVLFSQYQNLITSRLGSEGRLENKSISERLVSYQESWQMIKNNWVVGVGLGNYTYVLNRQTPNRESFYYQPTHNVFLLVWAETGIIGLLFFIGLLFVIARSLLIKATRQSRICLHSIKDSHFKIYYFVREIASLLSEARNDKKDCVSRNDNMAVILIALIIIMTFDHWLFSLHFGVLFFWLVIGLVTRNP